MIGDAMTGKPVRLETLLSILRTAIDQFPDQRTGNNTTYSMQDIGMAAFSVFYTQNPSFLAHQKAMREGTGRDNARTIFGIQQIPCDNHIRDVLNPVAPTYLSKTFEDVFENPSPCIAPQCLNQKPNSGTLSIRTH